MRWSGALWKVGDTQLNLGGGLAYVTEPVSLESNLYQLNAGDQVVLTTYDGLPGGLAALFAVDVNGTPVFIKVFIGKFDSQGLSSVGGTVPGGLSGLQVTMLALGFSAPGQIDVSNEVVLDFN